jgi:hypothetical protein
MQQCSSTIANPLAIFKRNLPARPYCSDTKRIKYIKHKNEAIKMPYIQCNHTVIRQIVFDVDHENVFIARDLGIAEPALIVQNRHNPRSHQIYTIDPIYLKTATDKAKRLYRDVVDYYKEQLDSDKVITTQKQLVKNPLSSKYDVITGKTCTLGEMAEYIRSHMQLPLSKPANIEHGIRELEDCIDIGRNNTLFEFLRHHAYAWACGCNSYDDLYLKIFNLGHRTNIDLQDYFPAPLSQGEIAQIAKSISRWTWAHRDAVSQRSKNIGIMGYEKRHGKYIPPARFTAETRRRQAQGGQYAARQRIINQLTAEGIIL